MMTQSLPAGQASMADLSQLLFRLEARASMNATIEGQRAAEHLDTEQRQALAVELLEGLRTCRQMADALA